MKFLGTLVCLTILSPALSQSNIGFGNRNVDQRLGFGNRNVDQRLGFGNRNVDQRLGLLSTQLGISTVLNQGGGARPPAHTGSTGFNRPPFAGTNNFNRPPFGGGNVFPRPPHSGGSQNFPGNNFGSSVGHFTNANTGNVNSVPTGAHKDVFRGCTCIPINQNCDPTGEIPHVATRIQKVKVNTRIINTNPGRNCPEEEKVCCFGTITPIITNTGTSGSLRGCGSRIGERNSPLPAVHGSQAYFGEFPWMVAILHGVNNFLAAGVLLNANTVLTAAHKIINSNGQIAVRVGDHDLSVPNEVPSYPHQQINVAQIILHPNFNPENLKNDIAILKLATPISFGRQTPHIQPACLPERRQTFTGQRCFVSGWGKNANNKFQAILNKVELPIIDNFACQDNLRRTRLGQSFRLDTDSFMCAGGEEGKDACEGDGGAPLVCEEDHVGWTVVGLVAWGIGCGQRGVPGAYVNIEHFVDSHIKPYL